MFDEWKCKPKMMANSIHCAYNNNEIIFYLDFGFWILDFEFCLPNINKWANNQKKTLFIISECANMYYSMYNVCIGRIKFTPNGGCGVRVHFRCHLFSQIKIAILDELSIFFLLQVPHSWTLWASTKKFRINTWTSYVCSFLYHLISNL